MMIVFWDGNFRACRVVEFSMDGTKAIIDYDSVVPLKEILKIVPLNA